MIHTRPDNWTISTRLEGNRFIVEISQLFPYAPRTIAQFHPETARDPEERAAGAAVLLADEPTSVLLRRYTEQRSW